MKRASILLFLLLGAAACATGGFSDKAAVPDDRPLYGYTEEGIYYLHSSLAENTNTGNPILIADVTGFGGLRMHKSGDYFILDIRKFGKYGRAFRINRDKGLSSLYCFGISGNRLIPRDVMGETDWVRERDVIEYPGMEKVFSTKPIPNLYLGAGMLQ